LVFVCFVPYVFAGMNYITEGIYVGDQHSAADIYTLQSYNISGILNVAWDLDIHYPTKYFVGDLSSFNENLVLQYHKVGLVDGKGNTKNTLKSAVYILHQLRQNRVLLGKDVNTFINPPENIYVHCHSGQSRSVTTVALYLFHEFPQRFSTYESALLFVKKQRHLENNHDVPHPDVTALALSLTRDLSFLLPFE